MYKTWTVGLPSVLTKNPIEDQSKHIDWVTMTIKLPLVTLLIRIVSCIDNLA